MVQQQRLDVGVGVVDRQADRGRALVAFGARPQHGGVDGMAGHQLLGLGGERRGLGVERRRLGLRQQGAHLDEHGIVDIGVPATRRCGRSGRRDQRRQRPDTTEHAQRDHRGTHDGPSIESLADGEGGQPSVRAGDIRKRERLGLSGPPRVQGRRIAPGVVGGHRGGGDATGSGVGAGGVADHLRRLPSVVPQHSQQPEQRPLRLAVDQLDRSGRQPVDSAGEVVVVTASCGRGGDVDQHRDPLAQREQRLVGAFAAAAPGTVPTAPAGPSGALLGAPLGSWLPAVGGC